MKKRNTKSKGFSLVELIFAVMMLTVIVFGVLKLQTSNLALSNTQNNELQAHFLANQGAEIVKALGTGVITCTPTCTQYIKYTSSTKTYSLDGPSAESLDLFTRSVEISQDGLNPSAYKVTVLVEWTDSTGTHTAEAKRIIY